MTEKGLNMTTTIPEFCQGIQYFKDSFPEFDRYGNTPIIAENTVSISDAHDTKAAYQTLLYADALRYLTLQVTASKASGHPGGFASSVEAYAALVMRGGPPQRAPRPRIARACCLSSGNAMMVQSTRGAQAPRTRRRA